MAPPSGSIFALAELCICAGCSWHFLGLFPPFAEARHERRQRQRWTQGRVRHVIHLSGAEILHPPAHLSVGSKNSLLLFRPHITPKEVSPSWSMMSLAGPITTSSLREGPPARRELASDAHHSSSIEKHSCFRPISGLSSSFGT
jgi:hypothetical protein